MLWCSGILTLSAQDLTMPTATEEVPTYAEAKETAGYGVSVRPHEVTSDQYNEVRSSPTNYYSNPSSRTSKENSK